MFEKPSLLSDKINLLILTTGAITSLIGCIVIIGWYTKTLYLIQVMSTSPPMQYNTALCFLLSGLGLSLTVINRSKTVAISGAIVFFISCAVFLQYLMNLDFGIDQIFVKAYVTTLTLYPGRMSPITAIAFMLCSSALIFIALPLLGRFRWPIISLLGVTSLAIGITVIYSYLAGVSSIFGVTQLTQMAVHTAFCFTLLSLGILSISWRASTPISTKFPVWLPLAIVSAGLIITLGLWMAFKTYERQQLEQILTIQAETVKDLIEQQFKTRITALARMANRWQSRGGTPKTEWEIDAKAHMHDFPDFQAIEWVDTAYHVRWIVPLEGNEPVLNLNLLSETNRKIALFEAHEKREPAVTRNVDLVQGGKGFLIYVPIFRENEFLGFIGGIIHTEDLLNTIFAGTNEPLYSRAILEDGIQIYTKGSDSKYKAQWTKEAEVSLGVFAWQIQVWPTGNFFQAIATSFSGSVFIIGVILSCVLGIALTTGERIRSRSIETGKLNQNLIQQISVREKTEIQLRESEQRFNEFMSHSPILAFIKDDNGHYTYMNQVMERQFNISLTSLKNKTDIDWLPIDIATTVQAQDAKVIATNQILEFIDITPSADGLLHSWLTYKFPIQDSSGRKFVGGVALDITARVKAEEQVKHSLKEKEIMLKEIHHRVKNNLQVVSSLLNLQSSYIKDAQALELFRESQHRVKSMALIHEKLYQSENLSQIDFGEYIKSLTAYLLRSYTSSADVIHLEVQVDMVLWMSIDTAIPCGLILNELFSNALKHGRVEDRDSHIRIKIYPQDENWAILSLADNGRSFPENLDFRNTNSLGLQLVVDLVRQIKGKIELERDQGTCFKIYFPL